MEVLYAIVLIYSLLCAPDLWFALFEYDDSPEYALVYLLGVLLFGFTLLGAGYRLLKLAHGLLVRVST